jgi:hypothetical protein
LPFNEVDGAATFGFLERKVVYQKKLIQRWGSHLPQKKILMIFFILYMLIASTPSIQFGITPSVPKYKGLESSNSRNNSERK